MSQTTETTTTETKATVKGVKTAPKKSVKAVAPKATEAKGKTAPKSEAKATPKAAAKKTEAPTEAAERAPRVSKYRDGIIKFLAQHPAGATDAEVSGALDCANSLRRVMQNDKDNLFKWEVVENVKGLTFSLTAAGKAVAKKL